MQEVLSGWKIAARTPEPGVEILVTPERLQESGAVTVEMADDFLAGIARVRQARAQGGTVYARTAPPTAGDPEPENHIMRVTWQTVAAILGGADWVETTPYNGSPEAAQLAIRTQQVLRHEAGLTGGVPGLVPDAVL